jgi:hypothetical protein
LTTVLGSLIFLSIWLLACAWLIWIHLLIAELDSGVSLVM